MIDNQPTQMQRRDFRRLWAGSGFTAAADSITEVAIPLIAVIVLGAHPVTVAALVAVEQAAWLLIGLPVGVLVDRAEPRRILAITNALRALVVASIPVAFIFGSVSIGQLFVVAGTSGMLGVFSGVASAALVPSIVKASGIVKANSRLASTTTAVDLGGKGVAGLLVQLIGGPLSLLVDSVCSLVASWYYRGISTIKKPKSTVEPADGFGKQLVAGLRYTFADPTVRTLTLSAAVGNLITASQYAITFTFLIRTLGVPAGLIGLVLAAASAGGLIGSLLTNRLSAKFGSGRAWRGALILAPVCGLLLPASPPYWGVVLYMIGSFGLSAGFAVVNIINFSARQAVCPDAMIGRVSATSRFLTWGLIPIGALLGGALVAVLSLRGALWVTAVAYFLAIVLVRLSPLWKVRHLESAPSSPL